MNVRETAKSSFRDLLYVIFKRKRHVILFFCGTVIVVAVISFLIQPTYRASAQILVKIGREDLYVPAVPPGGAATPAITPNREEQLFSEIQILKSRSLAQRVVHSLGPERIYQGLGKGSPGGLGRVFRLTAAPRSPEQKALLMLQKALSVQAVRKSDVIEVGFKHHDPVVAARVVNQLIRFYLDQHLRVHKDPKSYKFFQEQSEILKKKLEGSEDRLKQFKEKYGLTSIQDERRLLLAQEAEHRTDLNRTLSQLAETEQRILQLRHQISLTPQRIPQAEEMGHNPLLINTLQARLVELELKEKELLTKYTDQSRLVRNVKEEIRLVKEKLSQNESKRYESSSLGLNPTYQKLHEGLLRDEAELKALKAKREMQISQFSAYKSKLAKLNELEVELRRLKNEVDINRKNYQLYLTKFEESRISNAMDAERITNVSMIEPARPPLKPESPKILLNLLLSGIVGLLGGLSFAFLCEYMDDSLEKPEDAEEALNLPVLASIPLLRK